jgi:hypothetical protein
MSKTTKKRIMDWLKMENSSLAEIKKALVISCLFTSLTGTSMFWSYSRGDWVWIAVGGIVAIVGLLNSVYLTPKYAKLARVLRKQELEEAEKRMFEGLLKTSSPPCGLLSIEGKTAARVAGWDDRNSRVQPSLKNVYREDEVPKSVTAVWLVMFDEKGKPCSIMQEKRNNLSQYYMVP